jgi:Curli production assembly/transport component CsgG
MRRRLPLSAAAWLFAGAMALAGGYPDDALGAEAQDRTSASGSKQAVAVLQFEGAGASDVEVSAATDRMQEELFALGKFTLVDRAQINEILKEQALQQTGCTSTECAVKVGRILGVRVLVAGKVTRLDDKHWLIAASMIDAETAETLRSTSIQYEGDYFGLLRDGMPILAAKVAGAPPPEEPGFVGRIIDSVTGPSPTLTSSEEVLPKRGWGLFTGYSYHSGTLNLKPHGSIDYSYYGFPNFGIDYQWTDRWKDSPRLTLNAFVEYESGSAPSGDLGNLYGRSDGTTVGIEVRNWTNHLFVGGRVAFTSISFYSLGSGTTSSGNTSGAAPALTLDGYTLGVVAGYEGDRGWFLTGSLDFSNLSGESNSDPRVPNVVNAIDTGLLINAGYRWK